MQEPKSHARDKEETQQRQARAKQEHQQEPKATSQAKKSPLPREEGALYIKQEPRVTSQAHHKCKSNEPSKKQKAHFQGKKVHYIIYIYNCQ
jgi:hypothetical protein